MAKWQNRHINKYYAMEALKYGLMLQFKMSERKEGQKTYERNKKKIRKKLQNKNNYIL